MPEIQAGTFVTHNVRVDRKIGEGGMGSVWLAQHLGLDTQVAVKFIAKDLIKDDPAMVQRFKREAAAAAKIKSPHVVQVFDYGVMGDGIPFIVMELLLGESVGELLARRPVLAPSVVVDIATQTARALTDAHALGIVHRDIKPDNIFLTQSAGELFVKVVDFGIAKCSDGPLRGYTSTSSVFGTPAYMSPEQMMSTKNVDALADQWALGVTIYEMLTKRLPFIADSPTGMAVAVCTGQLEVPSKWKPAFASVLDDWAKQTFHSDKEQRYDSASAMVSALKEALPLDALQPVSQPMSIRDKSDWGGTTQIYDSTKLAGAEPRPNSQKEFLPQQPTRQLGGKAGRENAQGGGSESSTSMEASSTLAPKKQSERRRKGALVALAVAAVAVVVMWQARVAPPSAPDTAVATSAAPAISSMRAAVAPEPAISAVRTLPSAIATSSAAAEISASAQESAAKAATAKAAAAKAAAEKAAAAKAAAAKAAAAKAAAAKAVAAKAAAVKAPPPTAPPAKPKVDCSNPFYVDKDGIRRFKRECL